METIAEAIADAIANGAGMKPTIPITGAPGDPVTPQPNTICGRCTKPMDPAVWDMFGRRACTSCHARRYATDTAYRKGCAQYVAKLIAK